MIAFNNGFNDGKRYGRYGFIVPDSIDRTQKDYREGFYAGYASGFLDGAPATFRMYYCNVHNVVLCELCIAYIPIKRMYCSAALPSRNVYIRQDTSGLYYYRNPDGPNRIVSHGWYYPKWHIESLPMTVKCAFCGISKEI